MKHIIVAIHDRAVQAFNRPFATPTEGAALRMFQDEVNRNSPDNPMFNHADDYALFALGTFDDANGKLESLEVPKQIALAKNLKTS